MNANGFTKVEHSWINILAKLVLSMALVIHTPSRKSYLSQLSIVMLLPYLIHA